MRGERRTIRPVSVRDLSAGDGPGLRDGWQSRGIGKLLLSGLARRAAGNGVEAFTAVALGENRRVLGLADAVFAGARHTLKGGSYEMFMPLRGLRPATKPVQEIRPAA